MSKDKEKGEKRKKEKKNVETAGNAFFCCYFLLCMLSRVLLTHVLLRRCNHINADDFRQNIGNSNTSKHIINLDNKRVNISELSCD